MGLPFSGTASFEPIGVEVHLDADRKSPEPGRYVNSHGVDLDFDLHPDPDPDLDLDLDLDEAFPGQQA
jgi:hypothetical protein